VTVTRRRARLEWGLVALGLLVMFALLPHELGNDDVVRYADIEALIHHGHLSDSKYSLVMPLVSAPFLLLGEVVKSPQWWAAHFNVIVVAAAVIALARLARGRNDGGLLRGGLLVLVFCSYLTNRLRDYNAEVLTAAFVSVGVVAVVTGRARTRGWWTIVVGAVNTPAAIVGVLALASNDAYRTRRLRRLWPVLATAALVMTEAWLRRGSPFDTGYAGDHGYPTVLPYSGRPGFSYPFLFGVLSILFSFGRGLVFFMPALLFVFQARTRALLGCARLAVVWLLLFTVGLVLAYAKWWAWYGGASFGPRFFLIADVPASLLLAARLRRPPPTLPDALLTLAALAVSTWVAVIGALVSSRPPGLCTQDLFAYESLCWYSPEMSPLGHPLVSFPAATMAAWITAGFCLAVAVYLAAPLAVATVEHLAGRRPRSLISDWRV
jgi:hypothetical protein